MDNTHPLMSQAAKTKAAPACCQEGTRRFFNKALTPQMLAIVAASAAVGIGMALNWGWLVAAGIAPLIFSVLPCVVMCALGLCVSMLLARSSAKENAKGDGPAALPRQM